VWYQKCTVFTPTGLFHILWKAPCAGGTAAASVVWTRRPMDFRIDILVALEENCEKRRPMREAMLLERDVEDWLTLVCPTGRRGR